jgi:hypothetical protein
MRGCMVFLSIISWMSIVLTALFKGVVSSEVAVWALIIGMFLLATGGRRMIGSLMPIAVLLILIYSAVHGASKLFFAAVQSLALLAIICLGVYVMFSGLRRD